MPFKYVYSVRSTFKALNFILKSSNVRRSPREGFGPFESSPFVAEVPNKRIQDTLMFCLQYISSQARFNCICPYNCMSVKQSYLEKKKNKVEINIDVIMLFYGTLRRQKTHY